MLEVSSHMGSTAGVMLLRKEKIQTVIIGFKVLIIFVFVFNEKL